MCNLLHQAHLHLHLHSNSYLHSTYPTPFSFVIFQSSEWLFQARHRFLGSCSPEDLHNHTVLIEARVICFRSVSLPFEPLLHLPVSSQKPKLLYPQALTRCPHRRPRSYIVIHFDRHLRTYRPSSLTHSRQPARLDATTHFGFWQTSPILHYIAVSA